MKELNDVKEARSTIEDLKKSDLTSVQEMFLSLIIFLLERLLKIENRLLSNRGKPTRFD